MQVHLATHTKQFTCLLCEEAFHVEYQLDRHMQRKHSTEKMTSSKDQVIDTIQVRPDDI